MIKTFYQTYTNFVVYFFCTIFYSSQWFIGLCEADQTICNSNSKHCFSPSLERCDGIFNCPNGEDEVGCGNLLFFKSKSLLLFLKPSDNPIFETGISSHPVHLSNNCLSPSLWCDGNFICDGNNHQETCLKVCFPVYIFCIAWPNNSIYKFLYHYNSNSFFFFFFMIIVSMSFL